MINSWRQLNVKRQTSGPLFCATTQNLKHKFKLLCAQCRRHIYLAESAVPFTGKLKLFAMYSGHGCVGVACCVCSFYTVEFMDEKFQLWIDVCRQQCCTCLQWLRLYIYIYTPVTLPFALPSRDIFTHASNNLKFITLVHDVPLCALG